MTEVGIYNYLLLSDYYLLFFVQYFLLTLLFLVWWVLLITNDFFKKCKQHFYWSQWISLINPRTHTQIQIHSRGWNPPRVFDILQYFEMILPSVESLWSSQQDEVYFMSGGAAGGLWRNQQWSRSWPPSWISQRIRNQVKTERNGDFLCLTWKIIHKKSTLHDLSLKIYFYCWKKLEKQVLSIENGLTTCSLWPHIS